MPKKIIGLDPSAQYANVGLNGYVEALGCYEIADACRKHLETFYKDKCIVILSRPSKDAYKDLVYPKNLQKEIQVLNKSNCDIAIAIHTDAGGGRGVTCFKGGELSKPIGQALLDAIKERNILHIRYSNPIYHFKGKTYLGIIRNTKMRTVLIECGFHDSAEDIKVIGTSEGRQAVGRALADGISDYYKWEPGIVETNPQVIYNTKTILCNPDLVKGKLRGEIRSIIEALGFNISWNPERQVAKIAK